MYKTYIPESMGETVGQVLETHMLAVGRTPSEGEKVEFKDIIIKIETMNDNKIDTVEIIDK
jgi:CBS domain containing-hemolysin-like protein